MSKKFGLDWQDYDAVRMEKFIYMLGFEQEKANKDSKKTNQQTTKNNFR